MLLAQTLYMTKDNRVYIIYFFIASAFAFPCSFSSVSSFFATTIRPFSLASLSALAVSFLLFNYRQAYPYFERHCVHVEADPSGPISKNRLDQVYTKLNNKLFHKQSLIISLFLFFIITVTQFFIFDKISFDDFFFSIFWISIPLFIYLFSSIAVRYLSVYLYILWVTDLLVCFYTLGEKVGITGNRNWHASFLLVVLLFSIYSTYRTVKYLKKINILSVKLLITAVYSITAILTGYTVYLFCKCDSRAAILTAIVMLLIFIYKQGYFNCKRLYSTLSFSLLIISITILIPFFAYNTSKKSSASSTAEQETSCSFVLLHNIICILNDDVRIPLWKGAINLIKDYPFIGTSPARFESVFASYRPLGYFTKPNNAVRSNHPHNTLLYIAASFGLPALILWCFLWIYPMIYCFISYSKLSIFMRITLFAYFCLFFHGLLDLVLFHWPTIFLAAIFLGLLWNETWKGRTDVSSSLCKHYTCRIMIKLLVFITASLILILTLYSAYSNYRGTYFFRTGDFYAKKKSDERALYQYQRGLTYKKEAKYIYKAGMLSITFLNNPKLALYFFNYFNKIVPYDYAHKNGFIALSFVKLGKNNLALPHLIKEVINYPLSVGAWFRLSLIQRQQKMYKDAEFSLKNMQRALKAKGLPSSAINLILENPEYDSHPDRIPKSIVLNKNQNNTHSQKNK